MRSVIACMLALVLLSGLLLIPTSSSATTLYGHPYAMLYDRDNTSLNYNTGVVFMWNDMDPMHTWVGTAKIRDLTAQVAFSEGSWTALFQGMMHKKFTIVWTNAGPDSNMNDATIGDLTAFVVTIFGD